MKRKCLAVGIGIIFIIFGIGMVVFKKINEPFDREELVKGGDILLTYYHDDIRTLYIPEGKTVIVSVELGN